MQNILRGRKLTASRGGTFIVGVIVAVVAAVLLVIYLRNYRNSVKSDVAPTPVLVASSLIPKGTSGTIIAQKTQYATRAVPKEQLKVGAITDPSYLAGRVAVTDILPNSQMTAADFSLATSNSVQSKITGAQRAIALPVSGPQALVGTLQDGDRVDIYLQVGALLTLIEPNVYVIHAPIAGTSGGGAFSSGALSNQGGSQGMILRVSSKQAAELAFASGNGGLWFVLRPPVGAQKTSPLTVTLQSLLANRTKG
jgi:Flp pilus assembly protein CpaB